MVVASSLIILFTIFMPRKWYDENNRALQSLLNDVLVELSRELFIYSQKTREQSRNEICQSLPTVVVQSPERNQSTSLRYEDHQKANETLRSTSRVTSSTDNDDDLYCNYNNLFIVKKLGIGTQVWALLCRKM